MKNYLIKQKHAKRMRKEGVHMPSIVKTAGVKGPSPITEGYQFSFFYNRLLKSKLNIAIGERKDGNL